MFCCACYQTEQIHQIYRSQSGINWLSSSNFNLQGHMLSTDGDALSTGFGYFCKLSYQCGPGIGSKVSYLAGMTFHILGQLE